MMRNQEAMKQALRNKKAGAVDVTIVLGTPLDDEKKETKELGLAPDATPISEDKNETYGDPNETPTLGSPVATPKFDMEKALMGLGKGSLAHKTMMHKKG